MEIHSKSVFTILKKCPCFHDNIILIRDCTIHTVCNNKVCWLAAIFLNYSCIYILVSGVQLSNLVDATKNFPIAACVETGMYGQISESSLYQERIIIHFEMRLKVIEATVEKGGTYQVNNYYTAVIVIRVGIGYYSQTCYFGHSEIRVILK